MSDGFPQVLDGVQRLPDGTTLLPDGSAFAVLVLPLPADHWLYDTDPAGFDPAPPMPLRMADGAARQAVAEQVRAAARYAIRSATRRGREMDFDPDAMVQAFVVGLLGFPTVDGRSGQEWDDPAPLPPLWPGP